MLLKIYNFHSIFFGLLFFIPMHGSCAYKLDTDSLNRVDTIQTKISASNNKSAYVEFAGNSGFLSLNFDFLYQNHYSFRVGIGFYTNPTLVSDNSDPNILLLNPEIVVAASYLFFNSPYHIEFGIGMLTDLSSRYCGGILPNNCSRIKPSLFFGFRFQPFLERYIIRFGYTPFFDLHDYLNYFGISLGYCLDQVQIPYHFGCFYFLRIWLISKPLTVLFFLDYTLGCAF